MNKQFVRVLCDIHCDWEGLPPNYRVYVAGELFSERTWLWTDSYLEEILQINAESGDYPIKVELVQPCLATLRVENIRVDHGFAEIISCDRLRIKDATV